MDEGFDLSGSVTLYDYPSLPVSSIAAFKGDSTVLFELSSTVLASSVFDFSVCSFVFILRDWSFRSS